MQIIIAESNTEMELTKHLFQPERSGQDNRCQSYQVGGAGMSAWLTD